MPYFKTFPCLASVGPHFVFWCVEGLLRSQHHTKARSALAVRPIRKEAVQYSPICTLQGEAGHSAGGALQHAMLHEANPYLESKLNSLQVIWELVEYYAWNCSAQGHGQKIPQGGVGRGQGGV